MLTISFARASHEAFQGRSPTMRTAIALALSTTMTLTLSAGVRAEVYAYPAKGQSTRQEKRDKRECQEWATQQTSVDPSKTSEGGRKPGVGAGGAALGAARGAGDGEAGRGAARGAVRGRLLAAMRKRREEQQQDAGAGSEQPPAQREDYDRAYGACLTGRGYTVK
jgi:hypothetical protein